MDPRLSNLPEILGLSHADIDVIRTGGPNVTSDVLAELVVSTRVLGTTEIMLLNHTGCGFTTFRDVELNARLSAETGDSTPAPMRFFSFSDPAQNAREQLLTVRSHPWISRKWPCAASYSTWRQDYSRKSTRQPRTVGQVNIRSDGD